MPKDIVTNVYALERLLHGMEEDPSDEQKNTLRETLDHFTSLDLSTLELAEKDIINLSKALEQNTTVTTFILHGWTSKEYKMGAEASTALANMLTINKTIHSVDLQGAMNREGASSLALGLGSALRSNTAIIDLNLSNNPLGNEANLLVIALKQNNTLKRLSLKMAGLEITPAVAQNFYDALLHNTALEILLLGYDNSGHLPNSIDGQSKEDVEKFALLLESNTTLTTLDYPTSIYDEKPERATFINAIQERLKLNAALPKKQQIHESLTSYLAPDVADIVSQYVSVSNISYAAFKVISRAQEAATKAERAARIAEEASKSATASTNAIDRTEASRLKAMEAAISAHSASQKAADAKKSVERANEAIKQIEQNILQAKQKAEKEQTNNLRRTQEAIYHASEAAKNAETAADKAIKAAARANKIADASEEEGKNKRLNAAADRAAAAAKNAEKFAESAQKSSSKAKAYTQTAEAARDYRAKIATQAREATEKTKAEESAATAVQVTVSIEPAKVEMPSQEPSAPEIQEPVNTNVTPVTQLSQPSPKKPLQIASRACLVLALITAPALFLLTPLVVAGLVVSALVLASAVTFGLSRKTTSGKNSSTTAQPERTQPPQEAPTQESRGLQSIQSGAELRQDSNQPDKGSKKPHRLPSN